MAANTSPIYSIAPILGTATWLPATTANVRSDGTGTIGTDMLLLYTADTEGNFIDKIRIVPNASTSTTTSATVARIFTSTQSSGATTNANTFRLYDIAIPATTVGNTTIAATPFDIMISQGIPTGQYILVNMSVTAAANTSFQFILFGGKY
jgi:hypothetical protein